MKPTPEQFAQYLFNISKGSVSLANTDPVEDFLLNANSDELHLGYKLAYPYRNNLTNQYLDRCAATANTRNASHNFNVSGGNVIIQIGDKNTNQHTQQHSPKLFEEKKEVKNEQETKATSIIVSLVELPFKWIDKIQSESARKVIQGIITAAILGAAAYTYNNMFGLDGKWITAGSKSILNFLQYPIQLKLWVIILEVIAVLWLSFLLRRWVVSRLKHQSDTHLQDTLMKQNEQLSASLKELNDKIALGAQDPRFLEIINYIIDEGRAKGLRSIVERCLGSVDKGVPFIQQSDTFDEFMENANIKLNIVETSPVSPFASNGHSQFGVASRENPYGYDNVYVTIEGTNTVHMNSAGHKHFDWSFVTFKKYYDTKYQTPRGLALLQESSKAAVAIHAKYIPFVNAYPNCVFPLLGVNDTEQNYKARIEAFQLALNDLAKEMQAKEIFIIRKEKLKNLHRIMWDISQWVNDNRSYHVCTSRYDTRPPQPSELQTAQKLNESITKSADEIHRLAPLVEKDFEYLVKEK